MAKMKMSAQDRPKVKAQCLRLLAGLKLDAARATLIGGFVDSYLSLTAQEMRQYERELARFTPTERDATMELLTSWEQKGRQEGISQEISQGISQGKEELVMRLLRRRFGSVSAEVMVRLDGLSPEDLDELGGTLLDFGTATDLDLWLAQH